MNESLLLIIVGLSALITLLTGLVLIWLLREHKKLKHSQQQWVNLIQRTSDDVAGLCAAAIAVDARIAVNEEQIDALRYALESAVSTSGSQSGDLIEEPHEAPSQGYATAIEKIRYGASIEELVKGLGLTRDEAVLLTRLHGGRRN